MSSKPVNYDEVSSVYDQRYNDETEINLSNILFKKRQLLGIGRTLEVGCGTGHWLQQLNTFEQCFGLDLSRGMISRAAQKNIGAKLVQGSASCLPFEQTSFVFIYCVNAIHHFPDPLQFMIESRRVLEPGASLAIIGMDPHSHLNDWYIYHYFPGTLEKDLNRFPSGEQIKNWLNKAGFGDIGCEVAQNIRRVYHGRDVLSDSRLQKNGTSQLALLSSTAFKQGMRRIYADLEKAEKEGQDITFSSQIDLQLWIGTAV